MRAVVFVNGEKEVNQLKTIIDTNYLDFDLIITSSFSEFTQQFDLCKVDVVLCQIELKVCSAYEIFQLARMYNPEILCIAMGYKDCMQELIKVFNTENVYKFITMPVEYKDDLINPIQAAFDYQNGIIHSKSDTEQMSTLNEKLRLQIERLNDIRERNKNIFTQIDKLCNLLIEQFYYFSDHKDKNITIDYINNIYSNYIYYFYNNTNEIKESINQLKERANNPELNRSFKIYIADKIDNLINNLALFSLSIITDYADIVFDSYDAKVVIGTNMNHLLIKYTFLFKDDNYESIQKEIDSDVHKLLMKFLQEFTKNADFIFNKEMLEFRVIIN